MKFSCASLRIFHAHANDRVRNVDPRIFQMRAHDKIIAKPFERFTENSQKVVTFRFLQNGRMFVREYDDVSAFAQRERLRKARRMEIIQVYDLQNFPFRIRRISVFMFPVYDIGNGGNGYVRKARNILYRYFFHINFCVPEFYVCKDLLQIEKRSLQTSWGTKFNPSVAYKPSWLRPYRRI